MRFIEADWLYLLIVPILLMPVIAVISRNRRKKQLEALLGANADSPDAVHLSRTARVWRHLLLIGAASALIVADPGAAKLIKERIPDFELHASTQMSCLSVKDAEALAAMGFSQSTGFFNRSARMAYSLWEVWGVPI